MCGMAAAASSRSTVMRTISEPARASAATWAAVACTSAVSVLVINWTMIGAEPPTITPPTFTATERCRAAGAAVFVITLLQAHHAECQTVAVHVNGFMTDRGTCDDPLEIYYETHECDTRGLRREVSPATARWMDLVTMRFR